MVSTTVETTMVGTTVETTMVGTTTVKTTTRVLTTTAMQNITTTATQTNFTVEYITSSAPFTTPTPPTEPVTLIADLTISESFEVVCFNLDYFVQSFCQDVRDANPLDQINCTARSLNGVECPDGMCPCNSTLRRRLLQSNTNLSTIITNIEPLKPVVQSKQTWILSIKVTELPRAPKPVPSESSSLMLFVGVAVGALAAIGLGVGLGIGLTQTSAQYQKVPYEPMPAVRQSNKRLPKSVLDLKIK